MHELPHQEPEKVKRPSERRFGIVFAVVFALVALWPLIGGRPWRPWFGIIALAFLVAAAARPALLRPLNELWLRFGLLLHRVVSPVILGLIFFGGVTLTGWLMRLAGNDPMRRRWEGETYWAVRQPDPRPKPQAHRHQF